MSRIIKNGERAMQFDAETTTKLRAWAKGEMTWAEVEGMTFDEARAIAQIGCDLAAAGRLEEARVLFEGLVAGNPKDAAAQAALGTVYQKLGRIQDALGAYTAAIEHDPKNPVALGNRGELRLKSGDAAGFEDLVRCLEADPNGETTAGRRSKGLVAAIAQMAAQAKQTK